MITKVFNTFIFTAMVFAACSAANAQVTTKDARQAFETFRSNGKGVPTSRNARGVVVAANQQAFQIGKEFALAIDDAKYMGIDEEMFNYAVVDLVYLIDKLEGQPEAQQLQAILKGIVRDTKDLKAVSSEIDTIAKAFHARQTPERKWYFSAGNTQMGLLIAAFNSDNAGTSKAIKELQLLSRTAPQGTPQIILDAIKGLSKYAAIASLSKADFTALVDDTKMITTIVFA